MDFYQWFAQHAPQIKKNSIDAVLKLTAEGATVPFISRYRKEQTGNLNEVEVQSVIESKSEYDTIIKRKELIIEKITEQKQLTEKLKNLIQSTYDLAALEDIYAPYKQKRKTKAMLAKEAGLEPLTNWIKEVCQKTQPAQPLSEKAKEFISPEHDLKTEVDVLSLSQAIFIEELSNDLNLREQTKATVFKKGFLKRAKRCLPTSVTKVPPTFKYAMNFLCQQFSEAVCT